MLFSGRAAPAIQRVPLFGSTWDDRIALVVVCSCSRRPACRTGGTPQLLVAGPGRMNIDAADYAGHRIHTSVTKLDPKSFPLLERDFSWVQEQPYNR